MYQALLTRKYLTTKIMPLLATVAVSLSVGTVLVTWSVMGGFLETLVNSGRNLVGDVKIHWPNTGFAHYEDLIERLESRPGIVAAAPMIEAFGLVGLPDDRVLGAGIKGIDGERYARVTGFDDTIWWRPLEEPLPKDDGPDPEDPRLDTAQPWAAALEDARTLTRLGEPAAVTGIEMWQWHERRPSGVYIPKDGVRTEGDGGVTRVPWLINGDLTLHVMPLDESGKGVEVVTRAVPVANEFHTGVYEADSQTMFVRLDLLQRMLKMDEAERLETAGPPGFVINPDTGEPDFAEPTVIGVDPARVTTVLVRGDETLTADEVRAVCVEVYAEFAEDRPFDVPLARSISIVTWRDMNRTLIAAVEKETGLVRLRAGLLHDGVPRARDLLEHGEREDARHRHPASAGRGHAGRRVALASLRRRGGADRRGARAGDGRAGGREHQRDPRLAGRDVQPRDLGPARVLLQRDPEQDRPEQGDNRRRRGRADVPDRRRDPVDPGRPHGPRSRVEVRMTTVLEAADLHKTYRLGRVKVPVLKGVGMTLDEGEWVAVLGASGSGKSTLLHLLGGLDRPDRERGRPKGSIRYGQRELTTLGARGLDRYRSLEVGFVFQFYHLLPELSVIDNVCVGAMIPAGRLGWRGARRAEARAHAADMLEAFGLKDRLRHRPAELSGGERQRVAIARALINRPKVLLADEPTGNLDARTGGTILETLARLRQDLGLSVVMVTHDRAVAARADRVVTLVDGRLATDRVETPETVAFSGERADSGGSITDVPGV